MLAVSEGTQIALIGAMVTGLFAPTWLSWWNSRVARKQMFPNGGASLADKIGRMDNKLDRLESKTDRLDVKTDVNSQRVEVIAERQAERDEKLDALTVKVDEHIEFMRVTHDRTGQPERRNQ